MTKGQPRRIAVVGAGLIASAGHLIPALASTERQDAKVRPDEYIPPITIKETGRRHHLVGCIGAARVTRERRPSSHRVRDSASVTDISESRPSNCGCPGYVSHVIVQICRCRLLAVRVWGERNGDNGRSMPPLTHTCRLNSALPTRARRGRHGVWPSSATGIDPHSLQRKLLLPTIVCEAFCFAACRHGSAEPGTSSWGAPVRAARAGISRSRDISAGPSFTPAERQKRSRHPWPTSLGHRSSGIGHSRTGRLISTSTTDVDMRYSNRRTRNLSSAASAGPRRQPRSGWRCMADGVR
jgi:hypothetical protein